MPNNHIGQDVDAVAFIDQIDTSEEVNFTKLPIGAVVRVKTRNSLYEYSIENSAVRGGVIGDEWVAGYIAGSTFGGSMLAVDRLIPGALAEIVVSGKTTLTTSPIAAIEVVVQ